MLCSLNWVERMASSRRISRGFHRLAILLAAIPLLIGGTIAILESYDALTSASRKHQALECAYSAKQKDPEQFRRWYFEATTVTAFLKQLGCSNTGDDAVAFDEIGEVPHFDLFRTLSGAMLSKMGITLAVTLAVYVIVRAIGWVIGGFVN